MGNAHDKTIVNCKCFGTYRTSQNKWLLIKFHPNRFGATLRPSKALLQCDPWQTWPNNEMKWTVEFGRWITFNTNHSHLGRWFQPNSHELTKKIKATSWTNQTSADFKPPLVCLPAASCAFAAPALLPVAPAPQRAAKDGGWKLARPGETNKNKKKTYNMFVLYVNRF